MTTELYSSSAEAVLNQTETALRSRSGDRPTAEAVKDALLTVENVTRHQRQSIPLDSLLGRWRLSFTTMPRKKRQGGVTTGRGFYVPSLATAHIAFERSPNRSSESGMSNETLLDASHTEGEITNQVRVGSLVLRFTGPFRYESKKNILAFDFTQVQILLFDRQIFSRSLLRDSTPPFNQRPIAKLPFFAFIWANGQAVAARGRGGGLAIWVND